MKKIFLSFTMLLGFYTMGNAQISNGPACTFCKNNDVGVNSSALGSDNESTGLYSLVSGYKNQATGDYSHAFGYMNTVSNLESFAAGYNNSSNGIASICLGTECTTFGKGAFAAGMGAIANGVTSFALGQNVKTGGSTSTSFVIGEGNSNTAYLVNDVSHSLMIGFTSSKPTFFVSQAPGYNKTGKIGIGNITAPEAKLHIKADNNEDASIFLQPTGTAFYGELMFGDVDHYIKAKTGQDMTFATEPSKNFMFENGDINQTSGYHVATSNIIAPDANGLSLTNQSGNGLFVDDMGNVGLGTGIPNESLQIGDRWTFHNGGNKVIGYNFHWDGTNSVRLVEDEVSSIQFTSTGDINFRTAPTGIAGSAITWTNLLSLSNTGQIGIGTTAYQNGYLLTIDGKIMAEEVKIQNSDQWYDFVFDKNYELPALSDVESFVKENKHLPDVPSAQEVSANGYELGEMNGILLKKVEELTLYVIEQQKMMDEQQQQINRLTAKVEGL